MAGRLYMRHAGRWHGKGYKSASRNYHSALLVLLFVSVNQSPFSQISNSLPKLTQPSRTSPEQPIIIVSVPEAKYHPSDEVIVSGKVVNASSTLTPVGRQITSFTKEDRTACQAPTSGSVMNANHNANRENQFSWERDNIAQVSPSSIKHSSLFRPSIGLQTLLVHSHLAKLLHSADLKRRAGLRRLGQRIRREIFLEHLCSLHSKSCSVENMVVSP